MKNGLPFRSAARKIADEKPLTEGALRFHSEGAELLKITSARRVSLRFVAAEQISQAAAFLAALPQCSLLLFPKISLTRFFWEPFLLNYFCKQGCLAQQDPICLILEAYCP